MSGRKEATGAFSGRGKLTCISFFVLFTIPGWALGDVGAVSSNSKAVYRVGSIVVAGNRTVTNAEILSKIRSTVGGLFDESVAAKDAERIAELESISLAYYNTKLRDNEVILTFVVVERNVVRRISFQGNRKYNSKALRKKLGFERGDFVDELTLKAGEEALAEHYLKKGFSFS